MCVVYPEQLEEELFIITALLSCLIQSNHLQRLGVGRRAFGRLHCGWGCTRGRRRRSVCLLIRSRGRHRTGSARISRSSAVKKNKKSASPDVKSCLSKIYQDCLSRHTGVLCRTVTYPPHVVNLSLVQAAHAAAAAAGLPRVVTHMHALRGSPLQRCRVPVGGRT